MDYLKDLVDAFERYYNWVESGRFNEDEGEALRQELIDAMKAYFFGGIPLEDALQFANANSSHGWFKWNKGVAVKVEVDDEPEEVLAKED